jgi:hypothetical protein
MDALPGHKRSISQTGQSAGEPSSSRRKLDSLPGDNYSEASLDKAVLQTLDYEQPGPTFILAAIVDNAQGLLDSHGNKLLDPQYGRPGGAMALVDKHPELVGKLKMAWEAGKFKEIRNLGVFS